MAGEENKKYISTQEAAELTGYTRDYVGQLSRQGFFASRKEGGKLFVDEEGLLSYIRLNTVVNEYGQVRYKIGEETPVAKIVTRGKTQTQHNRNTFNSKISNKLSRYEKVIFKYFGKTPTLYLASAFLIVSFGFFVYTVKDVSILQASANQTASVIDSMSDIFSRFDVFNFFTEGDETQTDEIVAVEEDIVGEDILDEDLIATTTEALALEGDELAAESDSFLEINDNVVINDNIDINGQTVTDSLIVGGQVVAGSAVVSGGASIGGNISVGGAATIGGQLIANSGITTNGADIDAGVGEVFASNIINIITAGSGIEITGTTLEPIISTTQSSAPLLFGGGANGKDGADGADRPSTFVTLTDVKDSYTANRIFFTNSAGDELTDSEKLVFDGTHLGVGTSTPYSWLTIWASTTATTSSERVFEIVNNASTTIFSIDSYGIASTSQLVVSTTTATSTFAHGISLSGGCLEVNGSCITSGSGVSTYLGLTDTPSTYATNSIPYALGTTSLSAASTFVFDGQRLGIGTSSPYSTLSLWASTTGNGTRVFEITDSASTTLFTVDDQGVTTLTGNLIVSTTTATSTFANGISINAGCLQLANGNCAISSDEVGAGGSHATKVVAAYNSTNSDRADYVADYNNDEVQINAAIQAAYDESEGRGGLVYLLEGDYRVGTSTVTNESIVMATSTKLTGAGDGTSIIHVASSTPGNIRVISAKGIAGTPMTGVSISNLKIDGNKANQSTGLQYGVYFEDVDKSHIDHITVDGMRRTGIYMESSSYNQTSNSRSDNNMLNGVKIYANSNFNQFSGNTINGNSNDGMIAENWSNNNLFTNNTIDNNSEYAMYIETSAYNTITGSSLSRSPQMLLYINISTSTIVTNNTFSNTPDMGIYTEDGEFNIMSNNIFNGVDSYNIFLSSGDHQEINGNMFVNNGDTAIDINSNDNTVSDNIFTDPGGNFDSISINGDRNIIVGNQVTDIGSVGRYAVNVSGLDTIISDNQFTGQTVNDNGNRRTKYSQPDRVTIGTELLGIQSYSLLSIVGSSTATSTVITQAGTGAVLELSNSSASLLTVTNAGNVGIGTTSPYAKLSVVGETVSEYFTATSTTATSTFAGPISATSIQFQNETGIVDYQGNKVLDFWTGGGATNWLEIDNSTGNNSIDFYTYGAGTDIGYYFGATGNGSFYIDANGGTDLGGGYLQNLTAIRDGSLNEFITFIQAGSAVNELSIINAPTTFGPTLGTYGDDANIDLNITPKGTGNTILTSGNLGIGTSSPYAKLSVAGEVVAANFTATSTTATSTFAWGVETNLLNVTSTAATSTIAGGLSVVGGGVSIRTLDCSSMGVNGGKITTDGSGNLICAIDTGGVGGGGASTLSSLTDVTTTGVSDGNLLFYDLGTTDWIDTDSFVWDNTNTRLGIGTSTPYSTLSLWGATTNSGARLFEVINNASTTVFSIDDQGVTTLTGNLVISTTTATTTIAGDLTIGDQASTTNLTVSTSADIDGTLNVDGQTTLGNASTTNVSASGYLGLNSEVFTDLTGAGLQNVSGALALEIDTLPVVSTIQDADLIALYDTSASGNKNRKITRSDFLSGITGALVYQGAWDANLDSPDLADGTGTQGHYYVASTASTTVTLGSGALDIAVGDWVVHNGTVWEKLTNADTSNYLRSNEDDTFETGSVLTIAGGLNITGNSTSTNATTTGSFAVTTTATSTFVGGLSINTSGTFSGIKLPTDICAGADDGGVLTTDSNGYIICEDDDTGLGGSGANKINDLTDVTTAGVSDGNLLFYDLGTTDWIDSDNFVWDNTNTRLGVGTSTPYSTLGVWGATTNTGARLFEIANNASTTVFSIDDQGVASTSLLVVSTTTATSTFAGGVQVNTLSIQSTTATSTIAGGLSITGGGMNIGTLDCSSIGVNGGKITTDSSGNLICAVDTGGAGGGGVADLDDLVDVTTTGVSDGNLLFYDLGTTDWIDSDNLVWDNTNTRLGIGTSTPYATLSVVGQAVAEYFTATSTTATSTLPLLSATAFALASDYITDITGTGLSISGSSLTVDDTVFLSLTNWFSTTTDALTQGSTNLYFSNSLADARVNAVINASSTILNNNTESALESFLSDVTDVFTNNDTVGDSNIIDSLTISEGTIDNTPIGVTTQSTAEFTNSTTTNATTTNLFSTTASSTNLFTSNLSIGNLTGFLKATAGAVAVAAISLTEDISGILPTANGGTGWGNIQANTLLLGNGTGAVATTTAGTNGYTLALVNGVPTWVATSTLETISGELDLTSQVGTSILPVVNGGTNADSIGSDMVLSFDGTRIVSTSTPTFARIIATSTTATSTFAWGIETNLLNVTSSSATSTFANGIKLEGGCLLLQDGLCAISAAGSGAPGGADGAIQYSNGGAFNGGTDFIWDDTNNRLGIGTSTPYAKLTLWGATTNTGARLFEIANNASTTVFSVDDQGVTTLTGNLVVSTTTATSTFAWGIETNLLNVTSSSATSTFANGLSITGGCFEVNGTCLGGASTLSALSDVDTTGVAYGGLIFYNGSSWEDVATSSLNISWADVTNKEVVTGEIADGTILEADLSANTATNNDILTFNSGASNFEWNTPAELDIFELTDWYATTSAAHLTALSNLAQVGTITSGVWSGTALVDAKVDNNLTIAAGTINNTPIGASTASTAEFTNSTTTNATTTNLFSTTASSTNLFTSNLSVGNLSGFLKATAGSVATALINLTSDVEGILPTANGGTGWSNLQANTLLLGNGAGAVATTTAGTNGYTLALVGGVPTWVATSTLANISGTLAVGSGGTGQTSFGQGWLNSDGTTITSSTSPTVNYITATSTTATSTFAWGIETNLLNVTSSSATSTINHGLQISSLNCSSLQNDGKITTDASGNLICAIDEGGEGTGVSTFLALTDTPDSSFTPSAIHYTNTGASALLASADFVFDGTNLGVGTSTPYSKLSVWAAGAGTGARVFEITDSASTTLLSIDDNGNVSVTGNADITGSTQSTHFIADSVSATSTFAGGITVDTSDFVVDPDANTVGIGTTTASARLSIQGVAGSQNNLFAVATSTGSTTLAVNNNGALNLYQINPTLVGTASTEPTGAGRDVVVSGNYAYVTLAFSTGDDIEIFNIATTTPFKVGGVVADDSVNGVDIVGDYLYVVTSSTGDELEIFDISDPTNPTEVGSVSASTDAYDVVVSGNYAYVLLASGNELTVFDISDPTAPVLVGGANADSAGHNIAISGKYAYVTTWSTGDDLEIFDISDPTNPTEVGSVNADADTWGIAVSKGYAYVGTAGTDNDLEIYDVFDPAAPVKVGEINIGGSVRGVTLSGNYAYVTADASGSVHEFNIIDISDPTNPVKVGGDTTTTIYNVAISGNYAYLANASDELRVYDISGITAPSAEIGTILSNTVETDFLRSGAAFIDASLNVGLNALIGGALTVTGTLDVSGLASFSNASSTLLSVFNTAYFGGTATSSFNSAGVLTLASALGIGSGGTGVTSFGTNMLTSSDSSGNLVSTSTPTAAAYIATSTTATSTFAGGVVVGTNALVVDPDGENVGINVTSPSATLDIWAIEDGLTSTEADGISLDYDVTTSGGDVSSHALNVSYGVTVATNGSTFSGNVINAIDDSFYSYVASNSYTLTGNIADLERSVSAGVDDTLTVTGAVASIVDTNVGGIGTIVNSANVLELNQKYTNNTGSVLNVTTASTNGGLAARINDDGTFTDASPFVINSAGLVGIGTTSPYSKLSVWAEGAGTGARVFELTDSASSTLFSVDDMGITNIAGNIVVSSTTATSTFAGGLTVDTSDFVVDPDGNFVGIGTTTASARLALQGVSGSHDDLFVIATSTGEVTLAVSNNGALNLYQIDPVKVGSVYDSSGFSYGVFIDGDYAYVADSADGIEIFDISDPVNPTEIGSYNTGGNSYDVFVLGNYAYVADYGGGVEIIDVSSPTNPLGVGSLYDGGQATGIFVSGNYAYVADDADGLEIIDISDPTNPVEVGSFDDGGNGRDVFVSGNYAYVADGGDGLEIIDISDPTNPVEVGSVYDASGYASGIFVYGSYAYVADSADGIEIIDIKNPTNPAEVGSYDGGSAKNVFVSGDYAYVANSVAGIEVLNISDKTNPIEVGSTDSTGSGSGIFIYGNYAYLAAESTGLEVFDIGGIVTPSAKIGTVLSSVIDTERIVANTGYFNTGLNVGHNALIGGALTITGNASTTLTESYTGFNVQNGYSAFGTSTAYSRLSVWAEGAGTGARVFELTDSASTTLFSIDDSGNAAVTGTLSVSGLASFSQASSTRLSVFDTAYFGGTATSTFNSAGVLTLASALGIGSGGTGVTSFGTNMLTSSDASGNLVATSTPTVAAIFATSTATSTFVGGIETNLLHVTSTTATSTFEHGLQIASLYCQDVAKWMNGGVVTTDVNGNLVCDDDDAYDTGVGGTPDGSDGYLQFKRGINFGGDSSLFYDDDFDRLSIGTSTPYSVLTLWSSTTPSGANMLEIVNNASTTVASITDQGALTLTGDINLLSGSIVSGSITSGFGSIDNGTSGITTGGIIRVDADGSAINSAGSLGFGASDTDSAIYWNGTNLEIDTTSAIELSISGTTEADLAADGFNIIAGDSYQINNDPVLTATALGSNVEGSSLTSVGILTGGTLALDSLSFSGTLDDTYVNDTLTIGNSGTVDADALACDVGDDGLISEDCIGDVLDSSEIVDIYLFNNANDTTSGQLTAANFIGSSATASTFVGDVKVGMTSPGPAKRLSVTEASETQLLIAHNSTNYAEFISNSAGDLLIDTTGRNVRLNDENLYICETAGCPDSTTVGAGGLVVENAIIVGEKLLTLASTVTVDWDEGNSQLIRRTGSALTIAFNNYSAGQRLLLTICNTATAGSLTWPAIIKWNDGVTPTRTSTSGHCDAWSFYATDSTGTLKVFGAQTSDFTP